MRALSIILLLLISAAGIAQPSKPDTLKKIAKPAKSHENPDTLSQDMVHYLLNKSFNTIITGGTKSQIGNFASADLSSPTAAFNASVASKNGNIFTLNASGGTKNGLVSLFNSNSLNTDIAVQIKMSILSGHKKIRFYTATYETYANDTSLLNKVLDLKTSSARETLTYDTLKIAELNEKVKHIDSLIRVCPSNEVQKLRGLGIERSKLNLLKDSLQSSILSNYKGNLSEYLKQLKNSNKTQLQNLEDQFATTGFSLHWFSIAYKVDNSAFKLFNPTLTYAQQVSKQQYVSQYATVEYNWYNYRNIPNRTLYLKFGADLFIDDNLANLSTTTLSEKTEYGASPGLRSSTNTYTVYVDSNKYKKNLEGINLHAELYQFLLKNNQLALHFYPQIIIQQHQTPQYDMEVGTLYAFKNSKDTTGKSIINVELYCNFLDIFDNTPKTGNFYNRDNIGLRLTFPINFVTQ